MSRRSNAAEKLPAAPPPPASARAAIAPRRRAELPDDVKGRFERANAVRDELIATGVITMPSTGDLLDLGLPTTKLSSPLTLDREDRF